MTKKKLVVDPNYQSVLDVFTLAYLRTAEGKGKERHAWDKPFTQQAIILEGEFFGISPHLFQIRKKALEIQRMPKDAAMRELLDIMVYANAAYQILSLQED